MHALKEATNWRKKKQQHKAQMKCVQWFDYSFKKVKKIYKQNLYTKLKWLR